MARNSVRTKWETQHDLKRQPPNPDGVVLTGRGSWMKPKMSVAQLEARLKARLSTANPTHACSGASKASFQTAKRSVTRMSDNDPKEK